MFVGLCLTPTNSCSNTELQNSNGQLSKKTQASHRHTTKAVIQMKLAVPPARFHSMTQLSQLMICWLLAACTATASDESQAVSFRSDIAPILLDGCLACHGAKKAEGGYRVDSYAELLKAGDSGASPIAASVDQTSELLRRVTCEDASERMPAESDPLTPTQIDLIRRWIANGAKFDGQDAAQPLALVALVIPAATHAPPPEHYSQAVPITATAFSVDGKLVLTGGYHEVLVWNLADASLVRRIGNIGQRVFALAFSTDGKKLAVGCGEPGRSGEVRVVDFETGEVEAVLSRTSDVVLDLAFRPGTNELAIAAADSTIRIVNLQMPEAVRTIASHADWVTAVAWSEDGTRLASGSRDKSAKVYDAVTGELLASYLGHGAAVRGVSVLADSKQVVSVGSDNRLHRWDVEGAKKVAEVGLGGEGYRVIRSGNNLYVPCSDRRVLMVDAASNQISREFKGHQDWVLSAGIHVSTATEGSFLASGSFDGEVCVWDTSNAALVQKWKAKP